MSRSRSAPPQHSQHVDCPARPKSSDTAERGPAACIQSLIDELNQIDFSGPMELLTVQNAIHIAYQRVSHTLLFLTTHSDYVRMHAGEVKIDTTVAGTSKSSASRNASSSDSRAVGEGRGSNPAAASLNTPALPRKFDAERLRIIDQRLDKLISRVLAVVHGLIVQVVSRLPSLASAAGANAVSKDAHRACEPLEQYLMYLQVINDMTIVLLSLRHFGEMSNMKGTLLVTHPKGDLSRLITSVLDLVVIFVDELVSLRGFNFLSANTNPAIQRKQVSREVARSKHESSSKRDSGSRSRSSRRTGADQCLNDPFDETMLLSGPDTLMSVPSEWSVSSPPEGGRRTDTAPRTPRQRRPSKE